MDVVVNLLRCCQKYDLYASFTPFEVLDNGQDIPAAQRSALIRPIMDIFGLSDAMRNIEIEADEIWNS